MKKAIYCLATLLLLNGVTYSQEKDIELRPFYDIDKIDLSVSIIPSELKNYISIEQIRNWVEIKILSTIKELNIESDKSVASLKIYLNGIVVDDAKTDLTVLHDSLRRLLITRLEKIEKEPGDDLREIKSDNSIIKDAVLQQEKNKDIDAAKAERFKAVFGRYPSWYKPLTASEILRERKAGIELGTQPLQTAADSAYARSRGVIPEKASVDTKVSKTDFVFWNLSIKLSREVESKNIKTNKTLNNDQSKAYYDAIVWNRNLIGIDSDKTFKMNLREVLEENLDEFLLLWLRANK